ncbi:5-(carboxyamino)imidazole ribonucleotide synthase [Alkaliphilus serpentinus]|uniref:N5-carboxyaminoimidazole ribonucleotide synthase n=2 Tax=Alkaliphilus serpentinus TaxID=1482731 RepID=A0A833HQS6_9FIRM|nr:5-(carboxyamino)imidazole ribonucleotide synthase [Alkaliphilus serpentinus]
MMALEGKKLGLSFIILDPQPNCPAASVVDQQIIASFYDKDKIKELAELTDIITYEFEHIDAEVLIQLAKDGYKIYPSPYTLKIIQDKYHQKEFLKNHQIPLPDFRPINTLEDLRGAALEIGLPLILKSRRGGYDGKGNFLIRDEGQMTEAYKHLKGERENDLMVEAFVDFNMEVSAIVARSTEGQTAIYPLSENHHKNNILFTTLVPARISKKIENKAKETALKVMELLEGVGVFCIEMFVDAKDEILINEIAPRVHNSGHYSMEGCSTSQFYQHIRGILGLPLGSTDLIKPSVMMNLLGEDKSSGRARVVGYEDLMKTPEAYLHFYGKTETKPHRKMGHFTVLNDDLEKGLRIATDLKGKIKVIAEEDV